MIWTVPICLAIDCFNFKKISLPFLYVRDKGAAEQTATTSPAYDYVCRTNNTKSERRVYESLRLSQFSQENIKVILQFFVCC